MPLTASKANLTTGGADPAQQQPVRAPGPGKPRFQRKKPVEHEKKFESSIKLELVTDADFCQQLLVDGFVQSYVDFYHLTHRADPNQGEGAQAKISTSFEDMTMLRDNLMLAEGCRRNGNTKGVYLAYNTLGSAYTKKSDWKTAIFFQEKCLEVAQLTSDKKAELDAINSLGTIYQKSGDFSSARTLHERQEDLARTQEDEVELSRANNALYRVYTHFGVELESLGSMDEALVMYEKALEAASKSEDDKGTASANGAIGNILIANDKFTEGVPFLQEWVRLASELGDARDRCSAHSTLALAYDSLGRNEKALAELAMVQSISVQTGDSSLQSQAARSLGVLYAKVRDGVKSVASMEQHFDLLKIIETKQTAENYVLAENEKVITSRDVDIARVLVGVSKGNLFLDSFCKAVKHDAGLLLDWKLNRTALGPVSTALENEEAALEEEAEGAENAAVASAADTPASGGGSVEATVVVAPAQEEEVPAPVEGVETKDDKNGAAEK